MMANPAFTQARAMFARRPHGRRADLAREARRALDQVRPRCRRDDYRSPPPRAELRAEHDFRLRPLGLERLTAPSSRASTSCARSRRARPIRRCPSSVPAARSCCASAAGPRSSVCSQAIDAVEALGVDPADAAPDHWRHVHNRLGAGDEPRPYSRDQHRAWLLRRRVAVMTRFGYVMTTYFASLGIGASALFHPLPKLIWNASASVPIGLYAVHPAGALHVTELRRGARRPRPLASFLDERRYLPKGVPLLKRVARASWADRLPHRSRNHRRRRSPWAMRSIAISSGRPLPVWQGCRRIRCRRSLPDELAVRGLPRRPVFRPAARHHDRRPGRSSLDPRGGLIVPLDRNSIAGLAHAPRKLPSSVPAMFAFAARTSPSECTRRRHVSLALGLAIVVALGCNTVRAEPATARPVVIVAARTPFAAFVAEASQRFGIPASWISAVMRAESFGDVRADIAEGRHRPHADHARDVGCLAVSATVSAPILTTRTTTSSPAPPICASCTTATAFPASSRPTMPVPRAGKTISRPAGRCLRRRAPICPVSRRSSAEVQPTTRCILAAVVQSWTEASLFPSRPIDVLRATRPLHRRRNRLGRRCERSAQDWTALAPQSDGLFVALSSRERPP